MTNFSDEKLQREKLSWETLVDLERASHKLKTSPNRISRDMATAGMAIKKAIKYLEREVET